MVNNHLTDEQIQLYVTNDADCDLQWIQHAANCPECRLKVLQYQEIINAIASLPAAGFDFDLSQAVLRTIPDPVVSKRQNILIYIIATIGCLIIAGIVWYLGEPILNFFKGFRSWLIYLMLLPALMVAVAAVYEMYREYKTKMNTLNFYS